jgi:hypothetical protein
MTAAKKVSIVKDKTDEIPVEIMERAIVNISEGMQRLTGSRLTKRAIVLLVQDSVGSAAVTKKQVEWVLDAAASLGKTYLKQ